MLPDDAQVITSNENGTQQILQQTPQIQKNNQIIGMDKNNTPIVLTKDTEKRSFNNGETKPIISPPSQTQNGHSKKLKPYINPYANSKSKFGCDFCEEVFPTKYYLVKHKTLHTTEEGVEKKCKYQGNDYHSMEVPTQFIISVKVNSKVNKI